MSEEAVARTDEEKADVPSHVRWRECHHQCAG